MFVEEWTRQATGWVDDRNFEIDTAQAPAGFVFRVRMEGFPLMQDHEVFASAAMAKEGAIVFLGKQFNAPVELE
jgi:hypothetical protein